MEEVQSETWDIKKIVIALVLTVIVGLSFKALVLDQNFENSNKESASVQGANISASPTPSPAVIEIKKGVENKLLELQKEVNNINISEIATSTPAVKKVINDLQNLQSIPQNQAKEACFKICNGL